MYKESTIKYLMENKDMPIFGTIFKNHVYTKISVAYDVTTTFMEAINKSIDNLKEVFLLNEDQKRAE